MLIVAVWRTLRGYRRSLPTVTLMALCCVAIGSSQAAAQSPLGEEGGLALPNNNGGARESGSAARPVRKRGRVPCEEVVSKLDQEASVRKGQSANLKVLALGLGTTVPWVAHCMEAYGRRVPTAFENIDSEDEVEQFEEEEVEETAPEDVEEPGAREQREEANENSQDRRELHVDNPNKPAQEKEQVLHAHPASQTQTGFERE
jgi:hypothetical protein